MTTRAVFLAILILSVASDAFSVVHKLHNDNPKRYTTSSIIEEWDEDINTIRNRYVNGRKDFGHKRATDMPSAKRFFHQTFLPSGYPLSVPPEYSTFQTWNLLQDFCSYLRGIMATKAILAGMGVGRSDVTAAQATVLWILRDGASLLGGLIFTAYNSKNFGQNVKLWRLFADSINNVGITLNMLAPLFPRFFLPMICIGSICSALCGIAAGATGAAINAHWGSKGNIAEVLAKNGAQHTAVSLLGLLLSIPFTKFAERIRPVYSWFIYIALTMIHMISNYRAMRVLALTSFNIARYQLLLETFFSMFPLSEICDNNYLASMRREIDKELSPVNSLENHSTHRFLALSPSSIAAKEPILSLVVAAEKKKKKRVHSWVSISKLFDNVSTSTELVNQLLSENSPYVFFAKQSSFTNNYEHQLKSVNEDRNHYDLCFSHYASIEQQAEAFFIAYLLDHYPYMSLTYAQSLTHCIFPSFWRLLQNLGWQPNISSLRPAHVTTYRLKQ